MYYTNKVKRNLQVFPEVTNHVLLRFHSRNDKLLNMINRTTMVRGTKVDNAYTIT